MTQQPRRWKHVSWLQQLKWQLLLAAAGLVLAGGAIYSLIADHRVGELSRTSLEAQAAALAYSVASGGALHLVTGDAAALEKLLAVNADYPGVQAIAVLDAKGRVAAAVRRDTDGEVKADFELRTLEPPQAAGIATRARVVDLGGTQQIEAWAPVMSGARVGWVRAELGMEGARTARAAAQRDTLLSALAVSVLLIGVLYFYVGHALRPLAECARFATKLGNSLGSQLNFRSGSIEVRELANALNYASRELNAQISALSTIEALNHAVLDTAADAIIGFNAGGLISFINPAGCRIFGRQSSEVIGQSIERLLPEVKHERLAGYISEGGRIDGSSLTERFDTHGVRNGDLTFLAEVALGVSQTEFGPQFTCVARDLTEKKMVEDYLRMFRHALECSANGVVIVDALQRGLPVTYVNPAFERITGYSSSEVLGRNVSFLQADDKGQPQLEVLRAALSHGNDATVTLRNYRKDGTMFWNKLSVSPMRGPRGEITHYIGIQSDVTAAKRAEQALAEHSARVEAVLAVSPDGFVLFDQRCRFLEVNRAFSAMTGLSRTELIGRTFNDVEELLQERCDPQQPFRAVGTIKGPADAQAAAEAPPEVITLIQPERRILQRHVRVTDGGRELVLYYRDITRETEVDRMKSEFLSTAAHELRTPMVSIYGFSELLLKRKYPEERQRQFHETIYRQTGHLVNMVNELLDIARIEARAGKDFKIENLPAATVVRETAAALFVPKGRSAPLITLPDDLPLVAIDPEKFRQALMNVLSNAYKYSPDGGAVEISALQRTLPGRRQVGIVVEDHGLGMKPEQLARVFERFYRADTSGRIPGTGLGLSLVKEIIELHGGHVDITSEYGSGTRVVLWLQVAEAREVLAA